MKQMNKNYLSAGFLIVLTSLLYYFFPSSYTRQIKKEAYRSSINEVFVTPTYTPKKPVNNNREITKVIRVVDGDTIVIEGGQKVRYIGIDTPELHDPKKGQQCFGKEAAAKNEALVLNHLVRLQKDVSETDRYGRLLRYVYVQSSGSAELFVNEELVNEGYAQVDTYPPDVNNAKRFVELEQMARAKKIGLWGGCKIK